MNPRDETVTAEARCYECRRTATHRGPAREVAAFLRALVLAHVREAHHDTDDLVELYDLLSADLDREEQPS